MLSQAVHLEIKHLYREANMVVNWLSKYRHSVTCALSTTECFNTELRNIVQNDVIGRTLVRRGA